MKAILLNLFFSGRVKRRISAAIAAAVASYALQLLPGTPEIVSLVFAALLDLPEGTELSQRGLMLALTPTIYAMIEAVVLELRAKGNNKVLKQLQASGYYDGKLDGWVGPQASEAVEKLLQFDSPIQDER